jgi:microcystin-dependent protein
LIYMAQPYVGEIRMFGGNFAPAGWAMCDGQLMPISENETLFNLIGTTYGGDGQSTFALPNLQSRVPIHQGTNAATGTTYQLAEMGGVEQVTLTVQQIPVHSHTPLASTNGGSDNPEGNFWGSTSTGKPYGLPAAGAAANMGAASIGSAGGSQPHENMIPFLVVTYIISLFGVFPTQN